jgi:Flp pilus assembly protein TadG
MSRFYRSAHGKLKANESGQAAVEVAFAVPLLILLVCGAIDFGRALNTMQVISQLTRQGSNLALRLSPTTGCDNLCQAVADVKAAASGLNLANGEIIVTSLQETLTGTETIGPTGGPYTIVEQVSSSGGLTVASKLGQGVGTKVTSLPSTAPALQNGQYLYVTEIYYTFTPITPIETLTVDLVSMPSQLYDIAYFEG